MMWTASNHRLQCAPLVLMLILCIQMVCSQKYQLGVVILVDRYGKIENDKQTVSCALDNLPDNLVNEVGFKVTNLDKINFTPRGILDALCKLDTRINTVILILPVTNHEYLSIYKYTVNYISSLGIPMIIWNSQLPRVSVGDTFKCVHIDNMEEVLVN